MKTELQSHLNAVLRMEAEKRREAAQHAAAKRYDMAAKAAGFADGLALAIELAYGVHKDRATHETLPHFRDRISNKLRHAEPNGKRIKVMEVVG